MEYRVITMKSSGVFKVKYTFIENESSIYIGEKQSIFSKSHIVSNYSGSTLYTLRKPTSFKNITFEIIKHDTVIGVLTKGFFSTNLELATEMGNYFIQGGLFQKEYTIQNSVGSEVGKISRKLVKFRRQYGIALEANDQVELLLSIPIAIDVIFRMQQSS